MEAGITATNVETADQRITAHLAADHPRPDEAALADDLGEIRFAYRAERKKILDDQEANAEPSRRAAKRRAGVQHAHRRPGTRAVPPMCIGSRRYIPRGGRARTPRPPRYLRNPAPAGLEGGQLLALPILRTRPSPMVRAHDLRLANREIATEADADSLSAEIRGQLLAQLRAPGEDRLKAQKTRHKSFASNDVRGSRTADIDY